MSLYPDNTNLCRVGPLIHLYTDNINLCIVGPLLHFYIYAFLII